MLPRLGSVAVTLFGVLAACAGDPGYVMQPVEFTAPPGSEAPNLHVTRDGRAVLTWLEPVADERYALRVAVRADGRWSEPHTIVADRPFFVNWADFPSLTEMEDGTWIVHWLEMAGEGTYAYHVKLARSPDGGATWSEPIVPHRDRSPTEHGFVSMVPWRGGAALVWLDGRAMIVGEAGSGKGEAEIGGVMSLRFTTVGPDGSIGPEVLVDDRTCECCQTALAAAASGLVTAYRDRSEGEIRDIAVARFVDDHWTEPAPVAADGWHYPGCPVNGPQLSARGDTVAVAWYTAPEQRPRVSAAFSTDGGRSFGAPIRVDDGTPAGRVDVELISGSAAVVSWLEIVGDSAQVRARRVTRAGARGPAWVVAATSAARASGFPRMAQVGDELLFAWTLPAPSGGVRVAVGQ